VDDIEGAQRRSGRAAYPSGNLKPPRFSLPTIPVRLATSSEEFGADHMAEPASFEQAPANQPPLNFGPTFRAPAIDPTEWMPAESTELLRRLRDRTRDAHGSIPPFAEIKEASDERILAEQRLRTLQGHPQEFGHNLPDGHASVVQAKRNLQRATEAFTRLNERNAVKTAAWQAVTGPHKACEDWAKDGRPRGTVMEFYPVEPPKPAKGDTIIDLIEKLRRRGRELQADANRISSAQLPAAFIKAKMRERISQLAEAGCPNTDAMLEHDAPLTFAQTRIKTTLYGDNHSQQIAFGEASDSIGFMCWLMRDEIIRKMEKEIDGAVDPANEALSYEERERRNSEIGLDLLDIERQEAAAVWLAQSQGLPVEHRADCSPMAILQIQLRTVTGNGHDGPSTTTFAYNIVRG
jgi:hypothetical protein